jgi:hypothetical protein
VRPRGPAVDAELVLQAHHVDAGDVEEVGQPAVAVEVLLGELEPHFGRIVVAALDVVDRRDDAVDVGVRRGDRVTHVARERGDATLARQIIADEGDLANLGTMNHGRS